MTGDSAVPRPSRRIKIVLSVLIALAAWLLAYAPEQAAAAAFVPPSLLEQAAANPDESFHVIVVGTPKGKLAASLRKEIGAGLGRITREYAILRGVATELNGAQVVKLAKRDGIASITPDGAVKPASVNTVWPQAVNLAGLSAAASDAPTIAIVDSGIDAGRSDFAGRVAASVNLNSREPGATGDDNGHGTLVAGLAAGASTTYGGVAPSANLVSLDVVDADGLALTSDVIAAADWIFEHREQYGIRVANFSLHSAYANYGMRDPLSTAVRRLWLTGTVVVAAAGNAGPQRMLYSPGSDPFVITVGALDMNGTAGTADDFNAPWSSYGATAEGFSKPEVGRARTLSRRAGARRLDARHSTPGPGRRTRLHVDVGHVLRRTDRLRRAAQLLARHPGWTPDQVKGALMLTARAVPNAAPLSAGVGEIDAAAAAALISPPNPNENLYAFVGAGRERHAEAGCRRVERARRPGRELDERVVDVGQLDLRQLDQRLLDVGLLDERVVDERCAARCVLDLRQLDVGELDERLVDVRFVDVRQLDELTRWRGRGGAPPPLPATDEVNPAARLPMTRTKAHPTPSSNTVPRCSNP